MRLPHTEASQCFEYLHLKILFKHQIMVQSLGEIHNYKIVMRVNVERRNVRLHRRTDPTVK